MDTGTQMERYEQPSSAMIVGAEMSPQVFKDRIDHEQQMRGILTQYVKDSLVEGHHFSRNLGTTTLAKPMLLQEGARNICSLFKLYFGNPETTETLSDDGHFRVRAHIKLFNADGRQIASGDAVCSTREKKYAYLTGARLCPECQQPTVRKDNKTEGGGFYCWQKAGISNGCGAKFAASDIRITEQQTGRVENPDKADLENTVLKMAIKRAKTAAVCDVPMVSEIFANDDPDPDERTQNTRSSRAGTTQPANNAARQTRSSSSSKPARPASTAHAGVAEQGTSLQDDVDVEALRVEVLELLNVKLGESGLNRTEFLNGRNPDVMLPSALEKMRDDLKAM